MAHSPIIAMSRSTKKTKPNFNIERTTQIVGAFLERLGGSAYYILLVKLVYLTERTALLRWGRPLIFDDLVSMKNGTVPSQTLNLLKGESHSAYWSKFISGPHNKKVDLVESTQTDELSPMELDLIEEIFSAFGHWDRFKLADYTHELPEYTKTSSSIPIGYQEILKADGRDGEDIATVLHEIHGLAVLDDVR